MHTHEITLWCDTPDCTHWVTESTVLVTIARDRATRFHGWCFYKGKDFCYDCNPRKEVDNSD